MNKKTSKKEREELLKLAKKAIGSLEHVDIPGWETRESAAKWVHNLRHKNNGSLSS